MRSQQACSAASGSSGGCYGMVVFRRFNARETVTPLVSHANIGLTFWPRCAFRGIQAGKVESIRIDPDNPREILVQIGLREVCL